MDEKQTLNLNANTSDSLRRGTQTLFFTQIFCTLAFSVLYSTLVLYITKGLNISNTNALTITGSFIAFNYALHLLGGYCGGRLLSNRALFLYGMVLQIIGCIIISHPTTTALYWGLAAFLTGNGMNVTCLNCMVTQLFEPNDKRRESAFLWNYSGMNIGFIIGFTLSGYFQLTNSYHELFLLIALGNVVALIIVLFNWNILRDRNTQIAKLASTKRLNITLLGIGLIALLVPALKIALLHASFSNHLIMAVGAFMACAVAFMATQQQDIDARKKMWAYFILASSSLIFWTLYQIMPMGLTLFIEHNVNRHYLGITIPPQWALNINSIVIIIGGPALTYFFKYLRKKGANITIPLQFSMALILIGLGFVILPLGIHYADPNGYTSFSWIIVCYIFQSLGELFINPIGYAMIGRLAPVNLQGILMGTWLMVVGVAATLSNYFSNLAVGNSNAVNPLITNPTYSHTFSLLGWLAVVVGVGLGFFVPFIAKLTQEKQATPESEKSGQNFVAA